MLSSSFSQVNGDSDDFVVIIGDKNCTNASPPPVVERRVNRNESDVSLSFSTAFSRQNPTYFDNSAGPGRSQPDTMDTMDTMDIMEEGHGHDVFYVESSLRNISITIAWYCLIGIIIAINGIVNISSDKLDLLFRCIEFLTLVSFALFNVICLNSKLTEPSFFHWFINTFLLLNVWGYGMDPPNLFIPLALSHSFLPVFIFIFAVFNKI